MRPRVQLGIETLLHESPARVRGRRIGALVHPASVDGALVHTLDRLEAAGADVAVVFGPEHGLGGEAQDMEPVDGPDASRHAGRRAPRRVFSLYGDSFASLSPQPSWLAGLDAVVIDLQDVGARYYTFVWTALLMARACAAMGVEVIVCDRPNPLGGEAVHGAPQLEAQCSFVGLRPVPVQHGLTLAEMVAWWARDEGLDNVTVAPMRGWARHHRWEDTGLHWVAPSPNMPTVDTARVYPGGCLLEGTNLSEGRGTTRPFEWFGAAWLDHPQQGAPRFADPSLLAAHGGGGFALRAMSFKPMFHKDAGRRCAGVQVHVTDPSRFDAYRCYLLLLATAAEARGFAWRTEPYEFVADRPAIDLLTGDPAVRLHIDAHGAREPEALLALGAKRLAAWHEALRDRWIYTP